MAASEDLSEGSSSPAASALRRHVDSSPINANGLRRNQLSVHEALGGGAVADLILWKRRNAAVALLTGGTVAWFLFEIAGYGFLSLLANVLLLLIFVLFLWARSALLLNRPLPPLPNLEIPDAVAEKIADEARVWINRGLSVAREIAIEGDRKLFLQVIVILWGVSYIGSFFSFLTLCYLCLTLSLTVPVFYDKNQDLIHEKIVQAHHFLLKQYECVLTKTGISVKKAKKTD
ncbi:reticulon family protein [Wolffia australiana]